MPELTQEERRVRRSRIADAARQGLFKEEIMHEFEVSSTTVKVACREHGVKLRKHPAGVEEKCCRFLRLVLNGASVEAAARHLGIGEEMREKLREAAKITTFIK